MVRRRVGRVMTVVVIVLVAFVVFGYVTMNLWNWLMPPIFGLRAITFGQAIGLLLLSKLLLGGFRAPWSRRRRWRERMQQRWAQMSPEERDRFREGMRGRCGWGRHKQSAPEQKAV